MLSETAAVLTYIAELAAEGVLAPPVFSDGHYRMLAWLNFIATELHKAVFYPLIGYSGGDVEAEAARKRLTRPFAVLSAHLGAREFLEGGFSVADAYLVTVLNWCEHAGVALADWPVLLDWRKRLRARPSVAAAMTEEWPLLKAA